MEAAAWYERNKNNECLKKCVVMKLTISTKQEESTNPKYDLDNFPI
jgi:hypothetical protein